ncbi:winged helix-turn-helix transcriptional regulator [Amorphoplanes digitatis]|uniref:DNA-binding HxlR family transcriptional regulator n=1 Tax=Actinoplanes digitatis TaxID=1868 RepID=A0A7W7MRV8_9ACTN|nr:helix-turn-helix domain-containing protein [Actinoplanes digitatis]MBB4764107.1 DNA-binding HxlR family transcriptional regulator [Actinoplanes digitatis]
MSVPRPGRPVRGSSTGRPLMAALDLFGRRWNLRIVWELRHGAVGFRALQQRCDDMSSSVLRQRLTELLDAGLVEQRPDAAYALTELGHGAYRALRPLARWSGEWASAQVVDDPPGASD